jgi:hypothetical protein
VLPPHDELREELDQRNARCGAQPLGEYVKEKLLPRPRLAMKNHEAPTKGQGAE